LVKAQDKQLLVPRAEQVLQVASHSIQALIDIKEFVGQVLMQVYPSKAK